MISFSSLHPTVCAAYFLSVLLITMFTVNPILLIIALIGAVLFFTKCERNIKIGKELGFYLFLFAIVALTNPLFSHNGVTPLFFLSGNPVTLEAVLYGINLAGMLIAVIYWFKCFNAVMTADKLMFLFGKVSPKIALLLSSALRFIPMFKTQAEKIRQSQRAMGLYASESWTDKIKGAVRVYSSLIAWALENAIDTGASMKARGYDLKGRSHYSLFKFRKSDALFAAVVACLDLVVILAMAAGHLDFTFYPEVSYSSGSVYQISAVAAFSLLCLLPFMTEVKEGLQWKYYRSKI